MKAFMISLISFYIRQKIAVISLSFICFQLSPLGVRAESLNLDVVAEHTEFVVCRSDLASFVKNLNSNDLKIIKNLSSEVDRIKVQAILDKIISKGLNYGKSKQSNAIVFDSDSKSSSILIGHTPTACLLTIQADVQMDQIKINPDPTKEEVDFGLNLRVERTLMGSSYDIDSDRIHFDPSKALTIFKQNNGFNLENAIHELSAFQKNESYEAIFTETVPHNSIRQESLR
jgi:hypothetical protein